MTASISTPLASKSYPPGPKGNWLLGCLTAFSKDPIAFLRRHRQHYGAYMHFRLVNIHAYCLSDPELIKEVYLTHHTKFVKNRFFWGHVTEIFGRGLLTNEGEPWKVQRKLAAPAFQKRSISSYMDCMVEFSDKMLNQWQEDEQRSLHDEMMRVTADIAAKTLFNKSLEEGGQRVLKAVHHIEEQIPIRLRRPFFFIDRLPLKNNRIYRENLDILDQEVRSFIEDHKDDEDAPQTLLSMLMAARYDDGSAMSHQQLRDEVISIFLAGHDTTAISLSWTAYLLSHHPDIKARMLEEIDTILGNKAPDFEDLPQLPYTRNVLKESMRLYPAAYMTGRDAAEDVKVGDHVIRKGSMVLISPAVMHRLPEYFPDPDDFKPERWNDLDERAMRYIYIPFGGGPRVCIGEHFSMMEAMTLLTMMYQRFDLDYAGQAPEGHLLSATMVPKQGMPMRIKARGQSKLEHGSTSAKGTRQTSALSEAHSLEKTKVRIKR